MRTYILPGTMVLYIREIIQYQERFVENLFWRVDVGNLLEVQCHRDHLFHRGIHLCQEVLVNQAYQPYRRHPVTINIIDLPYQVLDVSAKRA